MLSSMGSGRIVSDASTSSEEPVLANALQSDFGHLDNQHDWPVGGGETERVSANTLKDASPQAQQGASRITGVRFADRGRLPTEAARALNEAWVAAGSQKPGDEAIGELCARFGVINVPRIERFFKEKERRTRRKRVGAGAGHGAPSLDVQRLQSLERFLFPAQNVDSSCPTALCGLRHVLRLESAGGIRDVGQDVYTMLRAPAGMRALRGYQYAYWLELRAQMLAISSLSANAAKFGAESAEIRLRLHFADAHAHYCFGDISKVVCTQRGNTGASDALATSIGRRQMSAVNERVRHFLRGVQHT